MRRPKNARSTPAKSPPSGSAPLIRLQHCSLILDGHRVLDDVDFTLRRAERWALIGPNGSGKTMLLKMIRGDVWPTPALAGKSKERRTYFFDGPSDEPAGSKEHIAYIGPERQDKYVRYGWNLSVTQVVTTGLFDEDIPLSRPTRSQRQKVERVLRRFGLWGLRQRHMLTLSYGQRRLALVARAFAGNAQVLLLDEVFNGLDARAKKKLRKALEQPRGGHDWILTSHRPKELPSNVTHVAWIEDGRLVRAGAGRRPLPGVSFPLRQVGEGKGRPRVSSSLRQAGEGKGTPRVSFPLQQAGEEKGRPRVSFPPQQGEGKGTPRVSSPPPRAGEGREGAPLVKITATDLYRDYRPVIRNLNWTLHRGEHWAVLGPNGSGKSTLLNLIHGDLHPALGGTIERAGAPFGTRIEEWKRRVGWVSPELQADHYLAASMEEIVISGRHASVGLNEPPTKADRAAAKRWLEFFGIESLRARGPRQVSYGQMRLALIARAMVNEPELLLLDEPCTGLDGDVRAFVLDALERLANNGTQIVMAVHDQSDIIPSIRWVLKIGRGGRVRTTRRLG